MAFPVIRASIPSAASDTDASSVVCTHPTGLTAGDLMILYIGMFNGGADRTITTPAGWTVQDTFSFSSRRTMTVYKKTATAGDVSAGTTTVSFSGTVDKYCYGIFAITGAASGSEITLSENDDVTNGAGATVLTATTALTPLVPESLVFTAFFATDLDLAAILTASSFSLTPTTTLTERVDVGLRDGVSDGCSLFIATGTYSGLSQITSRSVTVGESITGSVSSIVLLVNAPQDATGTNATFEVSPITFDDAGVTVGGTGTNTLLNVSPTIPTHSGIATTRPVWTNPDKGTTTWTNPNK